MKRIKYILLLLVFIPLLGQALPGPFKFFLGIDLGAGLSKIGKSQTIDGYVYADKSAKAVAFATALHGGVDVRVFSHLIVQLGLGAYQSTNYLSNGAADYIGESTQYNYDYNVNVGRLMAEGRVLLLLNPSASIGAVEGSMPYVTPYPCFAPFFEFGVGYAKVNAAGFKFTQTAGTPGSKAEFMAHNSYNSAWQVGGGLTILLNPHLYLVGGYRHVSAGSARLGGTGGGVAGTTALQAGKIEIQEFYGGVSYIF